ncbi:MAG: hypothetical protein FWH35_07190 [Treponema sp.]|nr:hypothetical protein [Treponema sp.]
MKNKFGYIILLVLVLTVFFGCKNGTQEVDGEINIALVKSTPVDSVSAEKTTDSNYVIITFDAVENVSSYRVFYQMEGKLSYSSSLPVYNDLTYALANGAASVNSKPNKFSRRYDSSVFIAGKRYRFGVRTSMFESDYSSTYSEITWSDYIKF